MSNVTGGGEGGGDSHIKEIGGHTPTQSNCQQQCFIQIISLPTTLGDNFMGKNIGFPSWTP